MIQSQTLSSEDFKFFWVLSNNKSQSEDVIVGFGELKWPFFFCYLRFYKPSDLLISQENNLKINQE